eukprot:scaffold1840_cov120-Isochrysis_galbana.AAC.4
MAAAGLQPHGTMHHRCSGHLPGTRGEIAIAVGARVAGCPTVVPFATCYEVIAATRTTGHRISRAPIALSMPNLCLLCVLTMLMCTHVHPRLTLRGCAATGRPFACFNNPARWRPPHQRRALVDDRTIPQQQQIRPHSHKRVGVPRPSLWEVEVRGCPMARPWDDRCARRESGHHTNAAEHWG